MNFEFTARTMEEASNVLVGDNSLVEDLMATGPGLYMVQFGSRGELEYARNLEGVTEKVIPSKYEACMEIFGEVTLDNVQYIEDYYYIDEDPAHGGVLNFSCTEEDMTSFILVK